MALPGKYLTLYASDPTLASSSCPAVIGLSQVTLFIRFVTEITGVHVKHFSLN